MSGADWRPRPDPAALRARNELAARARAFFAARGVLELDPPLLQPGANLDPGVQPFAVRPAAEPAAAPGYLPTSPEHALKRAVAAYRCDCWALSPAFRAGERGRWHRPEFRMLEWYRLGWDERRLADEAVELLAALAGLPAEREVLTWRAAWARAGLDPEAVTAEAGLTRDERLDLLYAERVEPLLGRGCWTVVTEFPAERAAQARVRPDAEGRPVAARFEIYREGLELANGYHECTDAVELLARQRAELAAHPGCALDPLFHAMLAAGLPDCAGVAVGFDRILAVSLGRDGLDGVCWH